MTEPKPIRVMIVDDHLVVRMGLEAILRFEKSVRIVATAEDGAECVALFRGHRPDVTLMDLRMPGRGGIEATREIRGEFPGARILMLTTAETEEDIHEAMEAGASGYLLKKTSQEVLVEAIAEVHRGGCYLPLEIARRLRERAATPELSQRQLEALTLLTKGLSNKEIAGVLEISEDGVKQHLRGIYTKLDVEDRVQAVTTAIQRGLVRIE